MTWIKICGTTNLEDALMAVEAGADALGFVFYDRSPRYLDPEAAREIVRQLPPDVEKVGVFVNGSRDDLETVVKNTGLTGAQIHVNLQRPGESLSQWLEISTLRQRYLVLPADLEDLAGLMLPKKKGEPPQRPTAIFLDSGTAEKPGGTGKAFDWMKAQSTAGVIRTLNFKLVVAGGLNPGNVAEAIRILDPWGVDVVSGVEASPGKKDPQKVRAFTKAVREAEKI